MDSDAEAFAAFVTGVIAEWPEGIDDVEIWMCELCGEVYQTRIEADVCEIHCAFFEAHTFELN